MTPCILKTYADLAALPVDSIIDVRSPAEFAEDHLPGAINLPVLDNAQRASVGTTYTQDSPFNARKIGGALVAQNTATHLQGPLADKTGDWQPLVYCWRGGQRSGAFATILGQVGWRVHLLQGGYRSYRRLVVDILYHRPLPHHLILIDGGTGTAKTRLLYHLAKSGAQVLDLEALARHRGSIFGAIQGGQPSQKMFESLLAAALAGFDPAKPVWIEAESSKIGTRIIPPALWTLMCAAPRIEINAPLAARAAFLCHAYDDLTADTAALLGHIDQLRGYHPADLIADWQNLATTQDWPTLAAALMEAHYDPRYAKSSARSAAPQRRYDLPDLDGPTLSATAARLRADFT
ncbi:MAG: tRNA 2-selenouridine synthase [Sulfitobacter sp.]|jgi:tRNA 2-selenouridine synthase